MRSLCLSPQNYNNMQMTNVLIECDCHARGNYAAHLHTSPTRAQPNISFARVPLPSLFPVSRMNDTDEMRCPPFDVTFTRRFVEWSRTSGMEGKGTTAWMEMLFFWIQIQQLGNFFSFMTWQLHRRGAKIHKNANYVRANKIICHRVPSEKLVLSLVLLLPSSWSNWQSFSWYQNENFMYIFGIRWDAAVDSWPI